eukprot:7686600-Pyramimonas_sp.AAC.1
MGNLSRRCLDSPVAESSSVESQYGIGTCVGSGCVGTRSKLNRISAPRCTTAPCSGRIGSLETAVVALLDP